MNPIKKANKKAWSQIKLIKNASNMVEVDYAISRAIELTFGLTNMGLIKIALRKGNVELCKQYGGTEKYNSPELLSQTRSHMKDLYSNEVRQYLIGLIPARLHKSIMYQNL